MRHHGADCGQRRDQRLDRFLGEPPDRGIADLEAAIDGAEDLPEGDTDFASAQGTLTTLKIQLNTAKTACTADLADKVDDNMKAMPELGKAAHTALACNATADTTALNNSSLPLRRPAISPLPPLPARGRLPTA